MGNLFLASYDLLSPGRDYSRLIDELRRLGAQRILESEWVLRSPNSAVELRDHFTKFIDGNDRLFICKVSDWAGRNTIVDINKVAA